MVDLEIRKRSARVQVLQNTLRAWLKARGSFPGPIFLSKQKRPIDRTTLHLLMKKYGAAAGIPEKLRHFHVLKHCCATHLLSKDSTWSGSRIGSATPTSNRPWNTPR